MTPEQFKAWRLDRRRTQSEVAAELGVSLRSVQLWELGSRVIAGQRSPVEIPRPIVLACRALSHGLGGG